MKIDTDSPPGAWAEEMDHMPWWVKLHVIQYYRPTDCGCHVRTETVEIESITLESDEPTQGS